MRLVPSKLWRIDEDMIDEMMMAPTGREISRERGLWFAYGA